MNNQLPDFEYEKFWYGFKSSISGILDEITLQKMSNLSEKLNLLQKQEKYSEIKIEIENFLEFIGYKFVAQNDYYRANIFDANLKRWDSVINYKNEMNTFNIIFRIYLSINKVEKTYTDEFNSLLSSFYINKNLEDLEEMVKLSVKQELYGTLDKLKYIIDLKKFVPDDKLEEFCKIFKPTTKSAKFFKYLTSFNCKRGS